MPWYKPSWLFGSPAPDAPDAIAKAAPGGQGGFTPSAPATGSPARAAGSDGVVNVGGFIVTGERDPQLSGLNKWVAYDNAILNVAIIASAVNIWTQLAGASKWTVEPNKDGGSDAKRAADIVDQGLINAQLTTPWQQIVRRQAMKRFRGFSLHEVLLRRRPSDDMIVVADIQDRPQWTIWRWNRPDPQAEWIGVEQMTPSVGNNTWYIQRERLFYSVENTLSPSPEGVGLLRQMADPVRRLQTFQRFEGIGFQTDLSGVPVARAPLAKIAQEVGTNGMSDAEVAAKVAAKTQWLQQLLANHNKNANQGILLDSATYTSKDPGQSPSAIYEWAFDLITGQSSSLGAVGSAIGREVADIARVMCAEWLLLGGQDSGGAYSMHEDKTAMFGLCVNSVLEDIASDARRDIAARLLVMNGLDPEVCLPRLVPEPVATGSVVAACQALAALFTAGLQPNDPAINVIRGRMNLPPAPEVDETALMLPQPGAAPAPDDGSTEEANPATQDSATAAADPEQAKLAQKRRVQKYDPDQPRANDGKWTSGGGGGGGGIFADRERRVDASLRDPAFMAEHGAKLQQIDDGARANFGAAFRDSPFANQSATAAVRNHIARIHEDTDAKSRGFESAAAEQQHMDEQHAAHEAAADHKMHAAIAAGHVSTDATKIADEFEAAARQRDAQSAEHAAALDHAHREALTALDDLHAMQHEGNDDEDPLEFEHTHLRDQFNETQAAMGGEDGSYTDDHEPRESPEFPRSRTEIAEDHPDRVPHPDEVSSDADDDNYVPHPDDLEEAPGTKEAYAQQLKEHEDYKAKLAADHDAFQTKVQGEYDAAKAAHATELKARAEAAQSALERLHEQQIAHTAAIKDLSKIHNKARDKALDQLGDMEDDHHVNHEAFAHHARDYGEFEDGGKVTANDVEDHEQHNPENLVDEHARADYERAYSASERIRDLAKSRIEEREGPDFESSLDALKDEQKQTARAIKELSQITGHEPRIGKPAGRAKK